MPNIKMTVILPAKFDLDLALALLADGAQTEGDKISEYAMKNSEEYFAESFVRYLQGNKIGINSELLSIFDRVLR